MAASMSKSDRSACIRQLCEAMDAEGPAALDEGDAQRLFAALIRLYASRREAHPDARPFGPGEVVSATDVAHATTGMLEAADMAVFELGMWQAIKRAT